jgi:hypothetical protein
MAQRGKWGNWKRTCAETECWPSQPPITPITRVVALDLYTLATNLSLNKIGAGPISDHKPRQDSELARTTSDTAPRVRGRVLSATKEQIDCHSSYFFLSPIYYRSLLYLL